MAVGRTEITASFYAPPTHIDYFNPLPNALPPDLGKLVQSLAAQANKVGFSCLLRSKIPPGTLTAAQQRHPAAPPINHVAKHGFPISISQGMTSSERQAALRYVTHTSESKEAAFFHQQFAEKLQAGHAVVFPLSSVANLPNLCIYPVSIIPQVVR